MTYPADNQGTEGFALSAFIDAHYFQVPADYTRRTGLIILYIICARDKVIARSQEM